MIVSWRSSTLVFPVRIIRGRHSRGGVMPQPRFPDGWETWHKKGRDRPPTAPAARSGEARRAGAGLCRPVRDHPREAVALPARARSASGAGTAAGAADRRDRRALRAQRLRRRCRFRFVEGAGADRPGLWPGGSGRACARPGSPTRTAGRRATWPTRKRSRRRCASPGASGSGRSRPSRWIVRPARKRSRRWSGRSFVRPGQGHRRARTGAEPDIDELRRGGGADNRLKSVSRH